MRLRSTSVRASRAGGLRLFLAIPTAFSARARASGPTWSASAFSASVCARSRASSTSRRWLAVAMAVSACAWAVEPSCRALAEDLRIAFGLGGTDGGVALDLGDAPLTERFEVAVTVGDTGDLEDVDLHADAGEVTARFLDDTAGEGVPVGVEVLDRHGGG